MADLKISALTASTTPLSGTEVLPIVQSSTTKKVSIADLTAGRAVSALSQDLYLGASNGTYFRGGSGNVARQLTITTSTVVNPGDTHTIDAISGSGNIILATAGVNRLLVNSNGNAALYTGNLEMRTSGKGIDFSANTGAAGMTSELLNWYEEGTWTPVLSATTTPPTVSYSNRTARYTRVGRLVTLHMWMNISSQSGGSGDVTITGLPFASANTSGAPVAAVTVGLYQNINPGVGLIMTPYIGSSSSVINLAASTQIGSGWGNLTTAALGASSINLQLTATYIV